MRKFFKHFKKRITLCILIVILCNPCFISCYSPNEVNKLEDYIFLGYVYEADVLVNGTNIYNRNYTEMVLDDHLNQIISGSRSCNIARLFLNPIEIPNFD